MPRSPHPEVARARAEVARASRSFSHADPAKVEAARRFLENNRLCNARLAEILAAAGPLTQEKLDKVAAILLLPDGEFK